MGQLGLKLTPIWDAGTATSGPTQPQCVQKICVVFKHLVYLTERVCITVSEFENSSK